MLHLVDDPEPELGALVLLEPEAENLLRAVGAHAKGDLRKLAPDKALVADLHAQSMAKNVLDEPLSNLDANLREQMRDELREMIEMFGMTAVHITHDQAESMALADKMICMRSGRIEQIGTPREIYRSPASFHVANFVGACSFVPGTAIEADEGRATFQIGDTMKPPVETATPVRVGTMGVIAIRPDGIEIDGPANGGQNQFLATTLHETFLGSHSEYLLDIGGHHLKADSSADLVVGQSCQVHIDPAKIVLVPG